jgi:hypothetical protein
MIVYIGMFGGFAFGLTIKRDLFEFLGDKFEDAYFFWELVLLSRKVLIMMSFLFFASMTEQAWFLGSAVVVVSLLLHCAAKPYEDELIDWCELLSLLSTLFIFQAGKSSAQAPASAHAASETVPFDLLYASTFASASVSVSDSTSGSVSASGYSAQVSCLRSSTIRRTRRRETRRAACRAL